MSKATKTPKSNEAAKSNGDEALASVAAAVIPINAVTSTENSLAELEKQKEALSAQLADMENKHKQALTARLNEITSLRQQNKSVFEIEDNKLLAELSALEQKLGIDNAIVIPENFAAVTQLDEKKPRSIDCSDELWKKLLAWPYTGEKTPKSLDGYILLVLNNADKEAIHKSIIAAAAKAMGHKSKSADFIISVGTALTRLKSQGFVDVAERAHYKLTAAGKAELNNSLKAANVASASPDKSVYKTLDEHVLAAFKVGGGKLSGSDMGIAVFQTGYAADENPQAYKDELVAVVKRFMDKSFVEKEINKEGSTIYSLTAEGKRAAANLGK